MAARIGIRREDKNKWEVRVPIIPSDLNKLTSQAMEILLQPSPIRVFSDQDYVDAGARISEDLSSCPVILGVKEMPIAFLEPDKTYVFFSHTIKGQESNMPMLQKLMNLGCNLIDYELITDDHGRRLVFFGRHAGQAGMIDTLWALGKRLDWEGAPNPFSGVKLAHEYSSLVEAKNAIRQVATRIKSDGFPVELTPFVCGFAGYGNVSQGAQEIFDLLPHTTVGPADLRSLNPSANGSYSLCKVVFKEEDLVVPDNPGAQFELQDYYRNPQNYHSRFENYLPYLTVLVNCIYWDARYPRLVTFDYLKRASDEGKLRLRVIGDISCDIEGSIQCTVKSTDPGDPVYVYDPATGSVTDGWEGNGLVIMAVDNLPCQLGKESSEFFSTALAPFVTQLANADFSVSFDKLDLPEELHRAMILHRGELTPNFKQLSRFL